MKIHSLLSVKMSKRNQDILIENGAFENAGFFGIHNIICVKRSIHYFRVILNMVRQRDKRTQKYNLLEEVILTVISVTLESKH